MSGVLVWEKAVQENIIVSPRVLIPIGLTQNSHADKVGILSLHYYLLTVESTHCVHSLWRCERSVDQALGLVVAETLDLVVVKRILARHGAVESRLQEGRPVVFQH